MGVDIQKQLDLRPYNDRNVVQNPVVAHQAKSQEVDEDKSNAAKWMIGLTATAAIVIGGLYAAKKGHLGEGAEKFAKKLFGESAEAAKDTKNTSATTTSSATSTSKPDVPPVLALITPAFVRGKIKNPKFKFNDLIQELEKANIKFEKFDATEFKPQRIKVESKDARYSFRFDADGALTSIRKAIADDNNVVYRFENNVLSKIERKIPTENGKFVQHVTEFAEDGAFKARKLVASDTLDALPFNNKVLNEFNASEIVEAYIPRTSRYFSEAVEEFQVVQRHAQKLGDDNTINVNGILRQYKDADSGRTLLDKNKFTPQKISEIIETYTGEDRGYQAEILKLIQKDVGYAKHIHFDTLKEMFENYNRKLRIFNISKPEHIATVGKPIKDCSYDELMRILREVAPEKAGRLVVDDPFKNPKHEQETVFRLVKMITGCSNINENTRLLDVLREIK